MTSRIFFPNPNIEFACNYIIVMGPKQSTENKNNTNEPININHPRFEKVKAFNHQGKELLQISVPVVN